MKKSLTFTEEFANSYAKEGFRVQKYHEYFWRLKGWIVGPLSEYRISVSGFSIGLKMHMQCEYE